MWGSKLGVAIAPKGDAEHEPPEQSGEPEHRPPVRRFSEEHRREAKPSTAARSLRPEAMPFVALAAKEFRATAQAADRLVENLTKELESLMDQMSSYDDQEIKRTRSICEALIKQARGVSNRSHGVLHWLEDNGIAAHEAPSEGVALIARQMAMAGASESEIERMLDELGVGDPEGAVARSLRDAPP